MSEEQAAATEAQPTVDTDASVADTMALLSTPDINNFMSLMEVQNDRPKDDGVDDTKSDEEAPKDTDAGEDLKTEDEAVPRETNSDDDKAEETDEPQGSASSAWAKVRKREQKMLQMDRE